MATADTEPVGPDTPGTTVAGAAVYAADRLTDGKAVTQADVAQAVETVVATSSRKIARSSQQSHDIAAKRGQPTIAEEGLAGAD